MAGGGEALTQFPLTVAVESPDECGVSMRIDKFLVAEFPHLSRAMAEGWLAAGRVTVNGKPITKKSHTLTDGDAVTIAAATAAAASDEAGTSGQPSASPSPVGEDGEPSLFVMRPRPLDDLHILFEDDDLMVVNKPAGLVVHPGAGTQGKTTMVEGLLHYLSQSSGGALQGSGAHHADPSDLRPGIVHRLDKDTSGAIVWAKTPEAQRHLAQQFHDKTNIREYIALVIGVMEEPVTAVSYQFRDPYNRLRKANLSEREYEAKVEDRDGQDLKGYRRAVSHFLPIKTFGGWLSLVKVRLETGRTHQIRSHALWLNRPVLADPLYGRAVTPGQRTRLPARCQQLVAGLDRQMLHGRLLGFEHPRDGRKLAFQAPFPADMKTLLEQLELTADS